MGSRISNVFFSCSSTVAVWNGYVRKICIIRVTTAAMKLMANTEPAVTIIAIPSVLSSCAVFSSR